MRGLVSFLTIIFGIAPATYLFVLAVAGSLIGAAGSVGRKAEVLGFNPVFFFVVSLLGIAGYFGLWRVIESRPTTRVCLMLACGIASATGIFTYMWIQNDEIWSDKSGFPYFIVSATLVGIGHILSYRRPTSRSESDLERL